MRFAIAVAVLLSGCHAQQAEDDDESEPATPTVVHVLCAPARTAVLAANVEFRGVLRPPQDREVVVVSLVAGRVRELRVHEGQSVHKGQWLANIDDPELLSSSGEASAARLAAQARLTSAKLALGRADRLFEAGIAAKREVDEAQTLVSDAQGEVDVARAQTGLAGARAARARVVAPIDGVVITLSRAAGDVVDGTSQTPLMTIADPSLLQLHADVPAADLLRLRAGALAEVTLDALPGVTLVGHVALVAPSVNEATALGSVRIGVDSKPDLSLKIGLAGVAVVHAGTGEAALLVRTSALRRGADGVEELVVCKRGQGDKFVADVRSVHIGVRSSDEVQVLSGVGKGELVVIDHALGLQNDTELVVDTSVAPRTEAP